MFILRLRKFGLFGGIAAATLTLGFLGYHSGSFKKMNEWAAGQALGKTAEAGFRVKDILVTGRVHIPAEELLAHLSIKENMPIFGVSIVEAQKSLTDISWVKTVSISRRLPDKIIVELKERTPAALWQYQKKISLIDQEGTVLATEDLSPWQNLPLVVGDGAPKHAGDLLGLLNAEPAVAKELVSAVWVGQRRWDLHLQNNIIVKLPEQDSELALRRLALLAEQKNLFGRNIAAIDLRAPEKMMITPVAALDAAPDKKNKKTHI